MAYSYTVTVSPVGPNLFEVTVNESDVGVNSEALLDNLPPVGTIRRVQSQFVSGSGAGVAPILGRTTDPAAAPVTDTVVEAVTTADRAARVDRCGTSTYRATTASSPGPGARLFHRSRPAAGSDNVVRTVYHIVAGSW